MVRIIKSDRDNHSSIEEDIKTLGWTWGLLLFAMFTLLSFILLTSLGY